MSKKVNYRFVIGQTVRFSEAILKRGGVRVLGPEERMQIVSHLGYCDSVPENERGPLYSVLIDGHQALYTEWALAPWTSDELIEAYKAENALAAAGACPSST